MLHDNLSSVPFAHACQLVKSIYPGLKIDK
uniref:Uncharacterized protein n=1 Tax=Rhizophora mucronata TaxID=61149 RepID=A0A2P2PEA4_RHIMU